MSKIEARGAIKRESVHPSITAQQISDLVDQFYDRVIADEQLGPIFKTQVSGDWDKHLDKMKMFWRSVLLRTGEYKGKPVPVHQKMDGIETQDFEHWLQMFSATTKEIFHSDAAVLVNEAAQKIATSLWLSRSSDPFVSPPDWSQTATVTAPSTPARKNPHAPR